MIALILTGKLVASVAALLLGVDSLNHTVPQQPTDGWKVTATIGIAAAVVFIWWAVWV